MANYLTLKAAIQQVVKANGNNEITGALLQQSLLAMINSLGAGYQYLGVATPTTNPGTPDQNVFYIASESGAYSNFGGLSVFDGEVAIFKYNGTWTKEVTGAATAAQVTQLGNQVTQLDLKADNNKETFRKSVMYVTYTYGTLASDGTIGTGIGYVSDYLPVIPGETLVFSNATSSKLAYYDAGKTFIPSLVPVSSGINEYTVPANAHWVRVEDEYNGGGAKYHPIRWMDVPENNSFADLILSPLKTTISLGFTGDSNTQGYGLASGEKSWADLLGTALANLNSFRFDMNSPWVESIGFSPYGEVANFKNNSQMSIWTDASSITIGWSNNYDSVWKWYVDGVYQANQDSAASLTLNGSFHKVTVRFTGGQLVAPFFTISKTITYAQIGAFGTAITNMPFETSYDWIFIMIGTNHRVLYYNFEFKFAYYFGKGTYVVPFPNHRVEADYAISQLQAYHQLIELFRNIGYDIVNCADINAAPFLDNTLYQSDLIHFNATGHKIIANMVAGKLGLPLYLQST